MRLELNIQEKRAQLVIKAENDFEKSQLNLMKEFKISSRVIVQLKDSPYYRERDDDIQSACVIVDFQQDPPPEVNTASMPSILAQMQRPENCPPST